MDALRLPTDPIEPTASSSSSSFSFAAFGVGIKIEANREAHLHWIQSRLDALMAGHVESIERRPIEHSFSILAGQDGSVSLFLDGEEIGKSRSEKVALQYLAARIKLAVGESTRSHIVVHAGVVAFGARAVVLPAYSFQGKTTLVRELVSRGALYYSDDLAIFDRDGLVHPFPKTLSVRGISAEYEQVEQTVESLGGVTGGGPRRVGLVLFTSFAPDAEWKPQEISPGLALLKLVEHTQNFRANPRVSMQVLSKVVNSGAVLWESKRRDAREVADRILERICHVAFDPSRC